MILHATVQCGFTSITRRLVETLGEGKSLPSDLLCEAAAREQPNIEMVKLIVAHGVDLDAPAFLAENIPYEDSEKTVMYILAVGKYWWHPLALDYLLAAGADPERTTTKGKTVQQVAIRGLRG